jgi:uncharacterized membrane protein YbhN (UPF0104 family)
LRNTLLLVISWAISIGSLVWVLHDIDFAEMYRNVERMHWGWVIFAMVADILVYFFQGWRWSMLLTPLAAVPFWRSVRAIYVGLFANEVLPFRTGEIIRCYLQARWSGLPFSVTLSSALIERIFDGIWLVICLVAALRMAPLLPKQLVNGGTTLALAILVGAALLGAAMFWKESTYKALENRKHLRKVGILLEDLHIIGHSRYLYFSAIASLPYLLMQVLPVWGLGKAYDVDLSLKQAFIVMVVLRFSSVVPQAPGNLGLFQAAAVVALTAIGIQSSVAKEFSVVLWAVVTLPLLITGFIALLITGAKLGKLHQEARESMPPAPSPLRPPAST